LKEVQDNAWGLIEEAAKKEQKFLAENEHLWLEIARLRSALKKANDQAEHFEREWYLLGDALENAATAARNSCNGWHDALMHEGANKAADAVMALMGPNVELRGGPAASSPERPA